GRAGGDRADQPGERHRHRRNGAAPSLSRRYIPENDRRAAVQHSSRKEVTMLALRLAILASALAFLTASAHAHAHLAHASPPVGSTVKTGRSEVRLFFTQALEPKFTTAQLRSSAGAVVATGGVDTANPKQIVIRVNVLPAGSYKVFWKVLSVDAHHTEGSFGF